MAHIKTEISTLRLMVDHVILTYAEGRMDQQTASICKLKVTEAQVEIVTKLQQLWGGYGYMEEYPIARCFSNSRVQPIYGGTSEIMKEIIARTI